jgi:hypothetical protein
MPAMSRRGLIAGLLLLAACRSLPEVRPADGGPWPASWAGRAPFVHGQAVIYARGEAEAREAADVAARTAADFGARTGREPAARVLVIAGAGGWGRDDAHRLALAVRGQAALDGEPPPDAAALARAQADLVREADETGVPPALLLALQGAALTPDMLDGELGLPTAARAACDAVLVLPLRDETEEALGQLMDAALAREEVSFAQRLLMQPLLPFVRGAMVDALLAVHAGRLYALHAAAQTDWSPGLRAELAADYAEDLAEGIEREGAGTAPPPRRPLVAANIDPPAATLP